jgi:hypothetical protein
MEYAAISAQVSQCRCDPEHENISTFSNVCKLAMYLVLVANGELRVTRVVPVFLCVAPRLDR